MIDTSMKRPLHQSVVSFQTSTDFALLSTIQMRCAIASCMATRVIGLFSRLPSCVAPGMQCNLALLFLCLILLSKDPPADVAGLFEAVKVSFT